MDENEKNITEEMAAHIFLAAVGNKQAAELWRVLSTGGSATVDDNTVLFLEAEEVALLAELFGEDQ